MTDPLPSNATSTRTPNGVTFAAAVSTALGVMFFSIGMLGIIVVSIVLSIKSSRHFLGNDSLVDITGFGLLGVDPTQYVVYSIAIIVIGLTLIWGAFLAQGRSTPTPAVVGLSLVTLLLLVLVVKGHVLMLLPMMLPASAIAMLSRPSARRFFLGNDSQKQKQKQKQQQQQRALPGAWHSDPSGQSQERWFDGQNWTQHVR